MPDVTKKQIDLFDKMLSEKDFGDKSPDILRQQFATLSKSNASEWLERALQLPDRDESGRPHVPPAF